MEYEEAKDLLYTGLKLYEQFFTPITDFYNKIIALIKNKYRDTCTSLPRVTWKIKHL